MDRAQMVPVHNGLSTQRLVDLDLCVEGPRKGVHDLAPGILKPN